MCNFSRVFGTCISSHLSSIDEMHQTAESVSVASYHPGRTQPPKPTDTRVKLSLRMSDLTTFPKVSRQVFLYSLCPAYRRGTTAFYQEQSDRKLGLYKVVAVVGNCAVPNDRIYRITQHQLRTHSLQLIVNASPCYSPLLPIWRSTYSIKQPHLVFSANTSSILLSAKAQKAVLSFKDI